MQLTHFVLPLALAATLASAAILPTPATSELSGRSQSSDQEFVKFDDLVSLLSRDDVDLAARGPGAQYEGITPKVAVGIALGMVRTFGHILKKKIRIKNRDLQGRDFDELEEQFQLLIRDLENGFPIPPVARDFDLLGF